MPISFKSTPAEICTRFGWRCRTSGAKVWGGTRKRGRGWRSKAEVSRADKPIYSNSHCVEHAMHYGPIFKLPYQHLRNQSLKNHHKLWWRSKSDTYLQESKSRMCQYLLPASRADLLIAKLSRLQQTPLTLKHGHSGTLQKRLIQIQHHIQLPLHL